MSVKEPTTNLGLVLKRWRVNEGLDLRAAAAEMRIGAATLMRIEHGQLMDATTMMKIWQWFLSSRPNGEKPRQRKVEA